MSGNFACKHCGQPESELHLFLQCPFARNIWELVPALHTPNPEIITSINGLLQHNARMIALPPTGIFEVALDPWILWYLWSARNKLTFDNLRLTEKDIVTLAVKEAIAWYPHNVASTHLRLNFLLVSCPCPHLCSIRHIVMLM